MNPLIVFALLPNHAIAHLPSLGTGPSIYLATGMTPRPIISRSAAPDGADSFIVITAVAPAVPADSFLETVGAVAPEVVMKCACVAD